MAEANSVTLTPNQRIRRQVAQRLSLRKPQEEALTILADIADRVDWRGEVDTQALLAEVATAFPSVESFERAFPSLCFALATGVGKTRLMGAFITYLYLTGRSKNFFLLAPNTTIYDKLVEDFRRQSSPKYVFRGIAEFAQTPPIIVTGDDWDEGRGIRGSQLIGDVIINIFNVDKINKEKGRIRSVRETLGESYFDYLAGLDDLVMLMDEAHRYRAKAAVNAVYDLKPKLGLELTATPKTVGASPKDFRNVIYRYGLGEAMADGYVKEPAVATRENFRRADYDDAQLERIMLEDGVAYHEQVKVELELYARQSGRPSVHPFMLVVARDTNHAKDLHAFLESEDFFSAAYRGRVIEVHSNQTGEESNEAMARLVGLEHDAQTDIVIHVNKLKEGWDVTNLYTIVPLRASASEILTEQTLGRGLRLPYGARTGNEMVDTLTIIAHDRFDEVIRDARKPDSVIAMKTLTIGEGGDITPEHREVVSVPTAAEAIFTGWQLDLPGDVPAQVAEARAAYVRPTPEQVACADTTMQFIRDKYERALSGGLADLRKPEVQAQIARDVRQATQAAQGSFDAILPLADVEQLVAQIAISIADNSIEIPEIVVLPSREVNFWFDDFDLANLDAIRFQPSSDTILIRNLRTDTQRELARSQDGPRETRVENYIIRHLMDFPEVDYDSQADLLYKLGGQAVERLRSYLATEEEVEAVALEHGKKIAAMIFGQMRDHYQETPVEYRARRVRSFKALKPQQLGISLTKRLPLTEAAMPLSSTPSYLFFGSKKCPYQFQKFDSDPERRFAAMIDSDRMPMVLKWLRPATGQFDIEYDRGRRYEPDFVVECDDCKLIVEVKAERELSDPNVSEKARAAKAWVKNANEFAGDGDGKLWRYILLADTHVTESLSFSGLMAHVCG